MQQNAVRRWLPWCAGAVLGLVVVMVVAGAVVAHRVQPILRSRIVNTLGERFGSPAALDALTVHYNGGLQVDGSGLRVQSVLRGVPGDAAHPMLRVDAFHFRVGLLAAMSEAPRIHHVRIRGVHLDLPAASAQPGPPIQQKHEIELQYAEVDDAHVRFASASADRADLQFDVPHLELRGVSRSRPIRFVAMVDDGVPIGVTKTQGTLGPWNFDDPRLTPVEGNFAFADKDVSGVRGLRGRLSLNGTYRGTVGEIHTEAATEDAAFGLDVSRHTVMLRTKFAMTLKAEQGEVAIERLEGAFGKTGFVCSGTAVKNRAPEGFQLDLKLEAPNARAEDVLGLVTRTSPAVLRGAMALDGRLRMRAGTESVSRRLSFENGTFAVRDATFSNAGVQEQVDGLSERAMGDPKNAGADRAAHVTAVMGGQVELRRTLLHLSHVRVTMPGAQAQLHGTYSLDGTEFAFNGTVHTEAKLSHMTTGVKSLLLKPFNGMFQHGKERGGAVLPLHVSGVGDVPHFATNIAGVRVKAPGEK